MRVAESDKQMCFHQMPQVRIIQWSFRKLTTMGTPKLSAEGAKFETPNIECRKRENQSAEGA